MLSACNKIVPLLRNYSVARNQHSFLSPRHPTELGLQIATGWLPVCDNIQVLCNFRPMFSILKKRRLISISVQYRFASRPQLCILPSGQPFLSFQLILNPAVIFAAIL